MFPARALLSPEDIRCDSLEATRNRFVEVRGYAIAATERLGELYATLDEEDPDDAAVLRDVEVEVQSACVRYDEALKRIAWEMRDAERVLPRLKPPNE